MNAKAFEQAVDLLASDPSEENMDRMIRHVQSIPPSDEEVAYLTQRLADSGKRAEPFDTSVAADIASTGGPSSLSTLLCPLYLRALGFRVPKVGVPGRPAGGLDVLAQIPGYDVYLDADSAADCLEQAGYAHVLAGKDLAPLDGRLFSFRKKVGAVAVPELIIASLLSKKLAVGLSRVGLDVRVAPHGNFGATWEEAYRNAERFNRVARLLSIEAVCFLTEARVPYQPYLGRGEALLAVNEVLSGRSGPWLQRHNNLCFAMATSTAGVSGTARPTQEDLEHFFRQNVEVQGGSMGGFSQRIKAVRAAHTYSIRAEQDGFLGIDLRRLRTVLVDAQAASPENLPFPDPCGIILLRKPGDYVRRNEQLATVRAEHISWTEWNERIKQGFTVSSESPTLPDYEMIKDR